MGLRSVPFLPTLTYKCRIRRYKILLIVIDIPARKSTRLEANEVVYAGWLCFQWFLARALGFALPLYPRVENNSRNCKEDVKQWRRRESADGGRGERNNELPLDVSGFRHNTDPLLTPLLNRGGYRVGWIGWISTSHFSVKKIIRNVTLFEIENKERKKN